MTDDPCEKLHSLDVAPDRTSKAVMETASGEGRPAKPASSGLAEESPPKHALTDDLDTSRRTGIAASGGIEAVFAVLDDRNFGNSPAIGKSDPERNESATSGSVVTLRAEDTQEARGLFVRERIDAAARPILEGFAKRRGLLDARLRDAIDGSMPLEHHEVVHRLGGAIHCEDMSGVIAAHSDPALVPLKVRAGLHRMTTSDMLDPPPAALREDFPDWNKPLVPRGRQLQSWHPEDAAIWLERFPPNEGLLHPIDTWDATTAALWLNDRDPVSSSTPVESEVGETIVAFTSADSWKPSLEVLHTLHEIELEELTYRVFVERLRREVMPFYVSERKVHIRRVTELVTFGYRTMTEARRSVRTHDIQRARFFDHVFADNQEWVADLCRRIVATHVWPHGFSEPELWTDFPDHTNDR